MRDSLYIGDIPLTYHYMSFDSNGNTLLFESPYNTPVDRNVRVYRIFKNLPTNKIVYDEYTSDIQTLLTRDIYDIPVSNKWYDRNDSFNILFFCCVLGVVSLFLINLFTSVFKKGGLLGGLF